MTIVRFGLPTSPRPRSGGEGLVSASPRHYVTVMQFFARMSPFRAVRDLRLFLHQRQKHELIFLFISVMLTGLLLIGFAKDSKVEKVYKPEIVYVQQWRLDRTDAEIKAQQAIDAPIKQKMMDEQKRRQEELRESFRKVDDKLKRWGL
ncbi:MULTISPECIES: hypothetical protein [unclassified Sphingomonas]|uniref:hypothetical protein n=1 Tax=unclassified Sphingomonas TaxID=196159 RepID=UPI001D0FCDF6|nr:MULTISPECIES: hypothetical protein [unclassified Sphingomonas]MCC2980425.1 hypothetical protein [Sphingomonas sp. IC4-52]MCD2316476.1 hypothetical protein [Sphingomonas sp. IC-11]